MHLSIKKKMSYKNAFKVTLILSSIMLLLFLPFIIQNKTLIWDYDGIKQHMVFLEYIIDNGYGALGSFDYNMGLGADYNISYSYYLLYDPFNLFFFLIPRFLLIYGYGFIIYIKFILTGLFMFIYLRDKGFSFKTKLIGAISYMLCGYATFTYIRHPCLISGCMYLPLMILGLERVIRERKCFLFIVTTFLSLITNFYMFFMSGLFAGIYALFYAIDYSYDGRFRKHLYFNNLLVSLSCILLGVLLGSFSLFPTIIGYFDAARSGSKGMLIYGLEYYFRLFATFLLPLVGDNYTPLNFNIITILLSTLFFAIKGNRRIKVLLLIFTLGVFVSIFGFTFNLFNYVNNRWVFILQFIDTIAICYTLRYLEHHKIKTKHLQVAKVTLCVISLMALSALIYGLFFINANIYIILGVTFVSIPLEIYFLIWFTKFDFAHNEKIRKKFNYRVLSNLLLFCVIFNSQAFYLGYSFEFLTKEQYMSAYTDSEGVISLMNNDKEFFRADKQHESGRIASNVNHSVANRYKGTYGYDTVSINSTYEFTKALGMYNATQNLGISGLNGRVVLNSLLQSKYFLTRYGYVPYGYQKNDAIGGDVYENPYFLPFGYVNYEVINSEDFLSLSKIERQASLMKGIVLDDVETSIELNNVCRRIGYRLINIGDYSTNILVNSDSESEVYLEFKNIKITDTAYNFHVYSSNMKYQISLFPKGHQMYYENTDFLLNFGPLKKTSIQIYNDMMQKVKYDNLYIYEYPMSEFKSDYENLKNNPYLEDFEIDNNSFKGKIKMMQEGYSFYSIPYSRGWKAYVDGERVEILKANVGFMALKLAKGEHEIYFKYTSPLFKEGIYVSILTGALLLTLSGIKFIYEKRKDYLIHER